jgi:hypothetical protein
MHFLFTSLHLSMLGITGLYLLEATSSSAAGFLPLIWAGTHAPHSISIL